MVCFDRHVTDDAVSLHHHEIDSDDHDNDGYADDDYAAQYDDYADDDDYAKLTLAICGDCSCTPSDATLAPKDQMKMMMRKRRRMMMTIWDQKIRHRMIFLV